MVFELTLKQGRRSLLKLSIEQKRCDSHQLPRHLFVDPSEPHVDQHGRAPFVRSGTQVGYRPNSRTATTSRAKARLVYSTSGKRLLPAPPKKKMFALYEFTRRGDVWLSACQVSTRRGAYVNVRDDLFARSRQTCSCSVMYLSDGTCCVWLNNVPRGPQVAGAP